MIRQAIAEDLEDIMIMIHDTVTIMQTEGNKTFCRISHKGRFMYIVMSTISRRASSVSMTSSWRLTRP